MKKQNSKLIMGEKGHVITESMIARKNMSENNWLKQKDLYHHSDKNST